MAKIWGQIENAQLENKSSDYSVGPVGRIWWNTSSVQVKLDDGTNIRALLRNDAKAIIGNNGTAGNNIRFHRGASGVLQFVTGSDVTAEGSLSTTLNQISGRIENYATGSLPAAANAGRPLWDTSLSIPKWDTGAAIKDGVLADATQILTNKTINTANNTIKSGVATSNQVLTADGAGNTAWQTPTTPNSALTTKTANFTLTGADTIVLGDATGGTFTLTLPTAVSASGKVYIMRKIDSSANAVSIATTSSQTIDGEAPTTLALQWEYIQVVSDGSNWQTVDISKRRTIQRFTSGSGTYTKPVGVKHLVVKMLGGGGGGGGSGDAGTSGSGGTGGSSTFGVAFLTSTGGVGGTTQTTGGAGGTGTINSGATGFAVTGGAGSGAVYTGTASLSPSGGTGGSSFFGGNGGAGGTQNSGAGLAGATNTGGGGGGASANTSTAVYGGSGGGAGGYLEAVVTNPSATYAYAVGAAGTLGTSGTQGNNGGAGAAGVVIVEEYYK